MPRFNLKTLLVGIGLFSIPLALLVSPRGRITQASANQIVAGSSVAEASRIIGVSPGWYDGISLVSGIETTTKARHREGWINSHGAIVADMDAGPGLQNIIFTPSSKFSFRYNRISLAYDRTLNRLIDSKSKYSTAGILLLLLTVSFLPAATLSLVSKCSVTESASFGLIVSVIVFVTVSIYFGRFGIGHHDRDFPLLAGSVALSAFFGSTLLTGVRITQMLRNRPSNNHAMIRSGEASVIEN